MGYLDYLTGVARSLLPVSVSSTIFSSAYNSSPQPVAPSPAMQLFLTTFSMRPTQWRSSLLRTYGETGLRSLYRRAAIAAVHRGMALIPREESRADGIVDQLGVDLTASESSTDSSPLVQTPADSPAPLPSFKIALPVDVELGLPLHVPDMSTSAQKPQLIDDACVAQAYVDPATAGSRWSSLAVAPSGCPAPRIRISPVLDIPPGLPFSTLHSTTSMVNVGYNERKEVRVADAHRSVSVAPETATLRVLHDRMASYFPMEKLGKGASGSVFLCLARPHHPAFHIPPMVAIKVFSKQQMIQVPGFYESVQAELDNSLQAELAGPFVAQVLSSFHDNYHVYFVMRHYAKDLWGLLGLEEYSNGMPIGECTHYAAELVLALEQIHKNHITHGDIKPPNILVTPSGHLALADFGHSIVAPHELRGDPMSIVSRGRIGTPGYFAPEAIDPNSKGWNRQIDLWAFGCVLLQMILGPNTPILFRHIVDANATHIMYQLWDVERSLQVVEDPDARDLLTKLLDKNPETRITLENVKTHPFFRNIDWEIIRRRAWTPPFPYDYKKVQYGPPMVPLVPRRDSDPIYAEEDWDYDFDFTCSSDELRDPVHGEMEYDLTIKPREPLFPPGLPRPSHVRCLSA